jgi:hypothetical protein
MDEDSEELRRELEAMPTEELISILRNRDQDEWRPEALAMVPSILAARGVSSSEIAALGPEGYDVVEGRELRTIGRYFSTFEAHANRVALEQAGIPAWVSDETLGSMFGIGVGTRLRVRVEDEAAARAVLEAAPTPASALPPDLAEPPCPTCGSTEVTQTADITAQVPDLAIEAPHRAWRYTCATCGHSWSD